MAKIDKEAALLLELKQAEESSQATELARVLLQCLQSRSNQIVAKAARRARDFALAELTPAMLAAYQRFLRQPVKTDSGCVAKLALIEALVATGECDVADFFLAASRYIQMQGAFGPPIDTAPQVRAVALDGLLNCSFTVGLWEAARLLADKEVAARLGAAAVLGNYSADATGALLRAKIYHGDSEIAVLGECFASLLRSEVAAHLPLVAEFLNLTAPLPPKLAESIAAGQFLREELAEAAALALAESKAAEAVELLAQSWDKASGTWQERLTLPLAISGAVENSQRLLSALSGETVSLALRALNALKYSRQFQELAPQIKQAAQNHPAKAVRQAYAQKY